jgi:hypothetical protein
MATMANREWGQLGQNYLKSLFALGFQGFLIMVCVGIYAVLVQTISISSGDIHGAIWGCAGYTLLLCFACSKPGALQNLYSAPIKGPSVMGGPFPMGRKELTHALCTCPKRP